MACPVLFSSPRLRLTGPVGVFIFGGSNIPA